jgi:PAS domain S-box-containing protein
MINKQQGDREEAESELFRLLVENAKDYAIFVVDPQGRVQSWNLGAERLLGYRKDEIIGQSFQIFFTPEDIRSGIPQRELREAFEEGRGNDDRWHVHKDGKPFWASGMMIPLWDDNHMLRGFAKIIRDRTEWKLAKDERVSQMKAAERRRRVYETALSNTPDLVYVFDLDHRLIYANDSLLKIWGLPWEEAIGKNCLELGNKPWPTVMLEREIEQVVATKQPLKGEVPFTGTFGRRIYEYIFVPVLSESGEAEAVVGTMWDVTERRQTEEHIRQSEARFRGLMEQAPFSIQLFSPDGQTIQVNRAWEELWGVKFEQIKRYNILKDRQLEAKGVLHYIQQGFAGQSTRVPAIQYNPNDTIPNVTQQEDPSRWLSAVIYPLKNATGQVQEVVLIHEDITARKHAEDALRENRERLELALQAANLGQWELNLTNHRASRNLRHDQIFGYDSLLPEWTYERFLDHVVPEDRSGVDAKFRQAMASDEAWDFECRIRRVDGALRWIWARGRAYSDNEGQSRRMVGTVADITERKRLEEALRESEEKLRLLADTIPQLAWMARPDGYIFWFNRRWYEYTGTTPEQVEGWGWQSVHDPNVLPKVLERWKESIVSGNSFDMIFPLKGTDGQFRPFLTRVNPLQDQGGHILYWFGTNTDISDIKRMEEALQEADRRKDEFLATLAHELRNPLAPLRSSLQILKMPQVDAKTAEETKDIMERQVNHLIRLVDDLLDVSRVMQGKIELRKESVELATVIARAVETAQPLIEAQDHDLEIVLPPEPLLLTADPVRLAQVIGNLLTNAAKYTEPSGHISLSACREDNEVVLRVRDNGIGIAPDMLPQIFELFVQVDHAGSRSQGGLGLGLALVKSLVEMHSGTVEAHSAGLGKGCEFVVRLPLVVKGPQGRNEEDGEQEVGTPSSGYRLLVVDDNEDAALSLAMLLRLQGHEVRVAHNGASALEVASAFRPALIFLDIGMPAMDGYEVACRMRQIPGLENTVLAALTGWGQQADRHRTLKAGFDYHLVKPLQPEALESLLAALPKQL